MQDLTLLFMYVEEPEDEEENEEEDEKEDDEKRGM